MSAKNYYELQLKELRKQMLSLPVTKCEKDQIILDCAVSFALHVREHALPWDFVVEYARHADLKVSAVMAALSAEGNKRLQMQKKSTASVSKGVKS